MISFRNITNIPWVQKSIGVSAAEYLRLVRKTSSFAIDPPDFYERVVPHVPFIAAMWHGQHFMMPFFRRDPLRAKVLISRHRDGEINSIAAERLGIGTIRGSGAHDREFHRKGGVGGFKRMLEALTQGFNIAITADVPKVSRVAGRGIVQLARASGRPIYPVIPATNRRIQLDNWDRSTISLPFGHFVIAVGEPIFVAAKADDAALELARRAVEAGLNSTMERAYAIVTNRGKDFDRSRWQKFVRLCSRRTSASP
jgi:lysophospholipid acyltransferase (LPLAT)-like uncharacterized protein